VPGRLLERRGERLMRDHNDGGHRQTHWRI
jgi:hypothetical protein